MAQCGHIHAETIDGFCHGLMIDGAMIGDKHGALGDDHEWPDFSNICYTDFGVPDVQQETKNSSSKKRKPDTPLDAAKRLRRDDQKASRTLSTVTDQKTDYIHVRARRGQATDSHSLAERVRRERISERMRYLQELVPGCNKVTGKAGMLDEIINYVQSLQKQVEFLSMKLAAANPALLNFNVEDFFSRQINQTCNPACPPGITLPIGQLDLSLLQFNSMQPGVSSCFGLDRVMNNPAPAPGASISVPVPVHDASLGSSLNVNGSNAWDIGLQNLFSAGFPQGNGFDLPLQLLQGDCLLDNLKMEM